MRRTAALTLLILGLVLSAAAPALAGGSWFYPIEEQIEPGDTVTIVGFSGFGPETDPDVPWDAPFFAHLEIDPTQRSGSFPDVHDGMVPLGRVTVTDTGQAGYQKYRLHLTFVVPADLDAGVYDIVHCNDPCTTSFGELIGGWIVVGDPTEKQLETYFDADPRDAGADWDWAPTADGRDPLVRELVEFRQLALTGPKHADILAIGALLILVGGLAVVASRTVRPS